MSVTETCGVVLNYLIAIFTLVFLIILAIILYRLEMSIRNLTEKGLTLKPTISPSKKDDSKGSKAGKTDPNAAKSDEEENKPSDNIYSEPLEDENNSFLMESSTESSKFGPKRPSKVGTLEFIKDKNKKPSTIPSPGQKPKSINPYNQKL